MKSPRNLHRQIRLNLQRAAQTGWWLEARLRKSSAIISFWTDSLSLDRREGRNA